jgi:hypothetical protein
MITIVEYGVVNIRAFLGRGSAPSSWKLAHRLETKFLLEAYVLPKRLLMISPPMIDARYAGARDAVAARIARSESP